MRRLAIFVEGSTELLFLEQLITEIYSSINLTLSLKRIEGGSKTPKRTIELRLSNATGEEKYYILICDCRGDHQVAARILEEHESLTLKGYGKIIGLRDVRPNFTHLDIPKLQASLHSYINPLLTPVILILSILEIEAWFLAEFNHFSKIDPSITLAAIINSLGFDPQNQDMSLRLTPADDLNDCYQIAHKTYLKGSASITISRLDYAYIYLDLVNRIPSLDLLVREIESALP